MGTLRDIEPASWPTRSAASSRPLERSDKRCIRRALGVRICGQQPLHVRPKWWQAPITAAVLLMFMAVAGYSSPGAAEVLTLRADGDAAAAINIWCAGRVESGLPSGRSSSYRDTQPAPIHLLHAHAGFEFGPWVDATPYVHLDYALDAIRESGNPATLLISGLIDTAKPELEIPDRVTLQFLRGGRLYIQEGRSVTIRGTIEAGPYQIFEFTGPTGRVDWGVGQPWRKRQALNQAWFGKDDDALQRAQRALAGGGRWYFPAGIYKQTTKIELPHNVVMYGDGPDKTIIISDVECDFAIEALRRNRQPKPRVPPHPGTDRGIRDFYLIAKGPGSTVNEELRVSNHASASGKGGILVEGSYYRLENLRVEGFRSGCTHIAKAKAGDPLTELKVGVELRQAVDVTIRDCEFTKNDVGLYVHEGRPGSSTTTSRARDCLYWKNRTHAIKLLNAHQFIVDGGAIQGTLGKYTVHITDSKQTTLRDLWLEGNAYAFTPGDRTPGQNQWSGSRDIYVHMTREFKEAPGQRGHIQFYNVLTAAGGGAAPVREYAYPEAPVELVGYQRGTSFFSCNLGRGPGAPTCAVIGEACNQTLFVGCRLRTFPEDSGEATTFIGCDIAHLACGDSGTVEAFAPDSPDVRNVLRAAFGTLPDASTPVTGLHGCDGQIVTLRGAPSKGSLIVKSATDPNFTLVNDTDTLRLAPGASITLWKERKDGSNPGGWTQLGLMNTGEVGLFADDSKQLIDSRSVWLVPDGAVTAIKTIEGGYHGQQITVIGNQSSAQACTVVHGQGNLRLAEGNDFAVGADDVVTLIFLEPKNIWHEVSRSRNRP